MAPTPIAALAASGTGGTNWASQYHTIALPTATSSFCADGLTITGSALTLVTWVKLAPGIPGGASCLYAIAQSATCAAGNAAGVITGGVGGQFPFHFFLFDAGTDIPALHWWTPTSGPVRGCPLSVVFVAFFRVCFTRRSLAVGCCYGAGLARSSAQLQQPWVPASDCCCMPAAAASR